VRRTKRWQLIVLLLGCISPFLAHSQVDPMPRELIQLGYNASFEGHAPLAGYAFYYRNEPNFLHTNLTLRLAVAPTYLDSELGISHVLGEHTDLGIGIAGGGFADSYSEINKGTYHPNQSFDGDGGEGSVSLYHCFNPEQRIPLNGVLRASAHYSSYAATDNTAKNFQVPADDTMFVIRTGLRWGGKEPLLFPSLAMELSVWYEGQFRMNPSTYGFAVVPGNPSGDRRVEGQSHLFWATALLAYTMTNSGQSFYVNLTAGTSVEADRFSAYRLGALLPLVSEFPLSLPGYYYQEISARQFVLLGGNYMIPLDKKKRWNVNFNAATAGVDYLQGFQQPGDWLSGVGAGVLYQTSSVKIMAGYAYGIDAIRSGGRGNNSIGFLMQFDLGHAKQNLLYPSELNRWRGWNRVFSGIFGE
jgi:hypothetical protein